MCTHIHTHTHIQTGLHRAHAQQQVFLQAIKKEQRIRCVSYICRGFNFNIFHLHFHFNSPYGCTIYCFYTLLFCNIIYLYYYYITIIIYIYRMMCMLIFTYSSFCHHLMLKVAIKSKLKFLTFSMNMLAIMLSIG